MTREPKLLRKKTTISLQHKYLYFLFVEHLKNCCHREIAYPHKINTTARTGSVSRKNRYKYSSERGRLKDGLTLITNSILNK